MEIIGDPITATVCLGGMRGPEGSMSRYHFDRRKRITLHLLVQEGDMEIYQTPKDVADLLEFSQASVAILHAIEKDREKS